jgi:hypothetical protein
LDKERKAIELTQNQIADKIDRHRSTVSRHVNKLIDHGLIERYDKGVYFYKLNVHKLAELTPHTEAESESGETKTNVTLTHHFRVHLPISNMKSCLSYSVLKSHPDVQHIEVRQNMRGTKLDFYINDLHFYRTERNLIFFPSGCGEDPDAAITNMKKKTMEIAHYFQQEFQAICGTPHFLSEKYADGDKKGTHFVMVRDTPDKIETYKVAWTDKSHEGALESADRDFVSHILNLDDVILSNQDRIEDLEARLQQEQRTELQEIKQALDERFTNLELTLTKSLNAFTTAMKNITNQTQQPQSQNLSTKRQQNGYNIYI